MRLQSLLRQILPLLLASVVFSGCTPYVVDIVVTGTAKKAHVTYTVDSRKVRTLATLPARYQEPARVMSLITVSARSQSGQSPVTVEIVVDGSTVQSTTAPSGVASASHKIPFSATPTLGWMFLILGVAGTIGVVLRQKFLAEPK